MNSVPTFVEELTYAERAVFGECPVCHAPHGTPCDPTIEPSLGANIHGQSVAKGVHLARLNDAPKTKVTTYH